MLRHAAMDQEVSGLSPAQTQVSKVAFIMIECCRLRFVELDGTSRIGVGME